MQFWYANNLNFPGLCGGYDEQEETERTESRSVLTALILQPGRHFLRLRFLCFLLFYQTLRAGSHRPLSFAVVTFDWATLQPIFQLNGCLECTYRPVGTG